MKKEIKYLIYEIIEKLLRKLEIELLEKKVLTVNINNEKNNNSYNNLFYS